MDHFDVVVIGAGSAGFAGARTLGAAGVRVGLVEGGPLGGLCILRGCMPTKALLRSTEVLGLAREGHDLGLRIPIVGFDFPAIMARKRGLVRGFQEFRITGLESLPQTTLLRGPARFLGPHEVQVGDRTLHADQILIATGSAPTVPPLPGLAEAGYLTSDEALELETVPPRMIVWGGGVIALEMGQFFARLGSQVTMVLRSPHVLSREDEDLQVVVEEAMERDGITLVRSARPVGVRLQGSQRVMTLDVAGATRELTAEAILVATGRHPRLDGLCLEAAGLEAPRGHLQVDAGMRTRQAHIYAAGDALGEPYLVHRAILQAEIAGHNMLGRPRRELDDRLLAAAIFTEPNVGRVGLSEKEAAAQGLAVVTGRYDFAELGKAECMGPSAMQGFVKVLAEASSGEIVGATIVGPHGADLIHELIVAMEFRCTAERFLQIPHLHPTLAEILSYPAEEIAEIRAARGLSVH